MDRFLSETTLLDFSASSIQELITKEQWNQVSLYDRIGGIYSFVRDSVRFGYNKADDLPASVILSDGYGQCNTKGILLMALFRACGIPCRIHGFTIDKKLQKGAITGIWYILSPKSIIHSWVEIYYQDSWINLEGFILDKGYISSLQKKFPTATTSFCGYGVATTCFNKPEVDWVGKDTYIQKEGINADLGVFDNPDTFFKEHPQRLSKLKKVIFQKYTRHVMNRNVNRIRSRQ
jgi:hypothetical protein